MTTKTKPLTIRRRLFAWRTVEAHPAQQLREGDFACLDRNEQPDSGRLVLVREAADADPVLRLIEIKGRRRYVHFLQPLRCGSRMRLLSRDAKVFGFYIDRFDKVVLWPTEGAA